MDQIEDVVGSLRAVDFGLPAMESEDLAHEADDTVITWIEELLPDQWLVARTAAAASRTFWV